MSAATPPALVWLSIWDALQAEYGPGLKAAKLAAIEAQAETARVMGGLLS